MPVRTVTSCLLALVLVAPLLQAQLLPDPDFEQGVRWSIWPPESPSRTAIDTTVAHSGKQSLCLTAPHPGYRNLICTAIKEPASGTLYRVTFYLRREPQVPDSALGFFSNFSAAKVRAKVSLMRLTRQAEGEWTRWSGEFYCPPDTQSWQFCIVADYIQGRVWLDDVRIEPIAQVAELDRDVWTYWLPGHRVGDAGYSAFVAHQKANDAVYQMARRYNGLLAEAAFAEDALRQVQRCRAYAGQPPSPSLEGLFKTAEQRLQEAYVAYGQAFRAPDEPTRTAFERSAQVLAEAVAALDQACAVELKRLRPRAVAGLPAHLGRQDPGIPPFRPDGRMNRLLFGAWSPPPWSEFEKPFALEFHSSAGVRPAKHTETELDFSHITKTCDDMAALGYRGTFANLYGFGIGGALYAPRWLLDKHAADPDFMQSSHDGTPASREPSRYDLYGLNLFHPAVQEYARDFLTRYATFCRREPRVMFYEVSHEANMNFGTGGPLALKAFHGFLAGKYGTVAALNRAWGSGYLSFEAIQPPPEPQAQPRKGEITPLIAEFEAFRDEAWIAYLKLVYDALKQGDPAKPVAARHAMLLLDINGARIFETCDTLSFHYEGPWMQVMHLYLNTLNRYAKKSLGYLEDFWALQEDRFRTGEEVATRRALEKHVSRCCIWGRTLQMKWYAYTAASYLGEYNGNWFDPRYEGTTMRYSALGLALAKRRMEQVDWVLTHSQIAPSRLAILQPSATMRNGRPLLGTLPDGERMKHLPDDRLRQPDVNAVHEIVGLHRLLYPAGLPYELVPEEYFADGRARLSDFSVIILPQALYLSADLQRKLADFATGGGTLVACGRPGRHNEIARPCDVLAQALGERADARRWAALEEAWTPPAAKAAAAERGRVAVEACGKGRVIACAGVGHLNAGAATMRLLDPIKQAAERLAWSEGNRLEVVLRVAEDGGRYLFLLNPDADRVAADTVMLSRPVRSAIDVTVPGGFPVKVRSAGKGAALDVRLDPAESAVIYLGK